jgi:hypothetical protein
MINLNEKHCEKKRVGFLPVVMLRYEVKFIKVLHKEKGSESKSVQNCVT